MHRTTLLCALASVATIPTATAAHPGGGSGGSGGEGRGGLMSSSGAEAGAAASRGMGGLGGIGDVGLRNGTSASANSIGVENREASRINSQALQNASRTAISHANQNSVLAGTGGTGMLAGTASARVVSRGALSGLTTGTTLFSNGTAVGTVEQIRTTGNGSVAMVVVKGTNGGLYAVPASKLSLSGGNLSTTARLNGVNATVASNSQARVNSQGPLHASATGIAHANAHSVLARGAVLGSALPGLTTGLTVNSSTGATLGTVSRVITGTDGSIRQVIVTSANGRTIVLSPATLSISGGVVTTTQVS